MMTGTSCNAEVVAGLCSAIVTQNTNLLCKAWTLYKLMIQILEGLESTCSAVYHPSVIGFNHIFPHSKFPWNLGVSLGLPSMFLFSCFECFNTYVFLAKNMYLKCSIHILLFK